MESLLESLGSKKHLERWAPYVVVNGGDMGPTPINGRKEMGFTGVKFHPENKWGDKSFDFWCVFCAPDFVRTYHRCVEGRKTYLLRIEGTQQVTYLLSSALFILRGHVPSHHKRFEEIKYSGTIHFLKQQHRPPKVLIYVIWLEIFHVQ